LATSSAKNAEASIVAEDELALAPLEIVMVEKEKEEKKKHHPIIIKMKPQHSFSSPNGTATTMMTEVNELHDSGFMENDTNKQQHDGDDAHAER
jgi:hypothetical protein